MSRASALAILSAAIQTIPFIQYTGFFGIATVISERVAKGSIHRRLPLTRNAPMGGLTAIPEVRD